jgi:hypothetical protein
MPWFMVDDGFHGHPKVVELELAAVGLWTLAGSWCSQFLTDGRVSTKTLTRFGGTPEMIQSLIDAELWFAIPDDPKFDFEFKDWKDYQRLREVVLAEREAARVRVAAARAAKKGVRPNTSRTTPVRSAEVRVAQGSEEVRIAPALPSPSLPNPSQPVPPAVVPAPKTAPTPRGTRLTSAFQVTPEMVRWANDRVPGLDGKLSTETFMNHWMSKTGKDATKIDWVLTWKNWLISDYENGKHMRPSSAAGQQPRGRPLNAVEKGRASDAAVLDWLGYDPSDPEQGVINS